MRKQRPDLTLLKGTGKGKPAGKETEPVEPAEMRPPSWLTGVGRKHFVDLRDKLAAMRPLVDADRERLAVTADAYAHFREATKATHREPMVLGSQGQMVANPERRRMEAMHDRYCKGLEALGLSHREVKVSKAKARSPWSNNGRTGANG